MILWMLLDTVGMLFLAVGSWLIVAKATERDIWTRILAAQHNDGDADKSIGICLFLGALLLCAGIALAFK